MQESKYRLLYNNVTDKKENEIDFKMDTRNISGNTKELKYYKCIFSPSVICVYPEEKSACPRQKSINFIKVL